MDVFCPMPALDKDSAKNTRMIMVNDVFPSLNR
jgi:hypothetical protein